jgi:hypothetical protein
VSLGQKLERERLLDHDLELALLGQRGQGFEAGAVGLERRSWSRALPVPRLR